ncbi:hypothetical protein K4L44_13905 [Halosquirtibacter laminarini]|uniref:Uncharacterized protein n=1 Tax=Halosquirtibacter laminarini TaxID=3374600 RepID=A0AC61NDK7_9BACT|nr:hypothetical protein K4L44_13905 [Prolixibacteraceae bacterium]
MRISIFLIAIAICMGCKTKLSHDYTLDQAKCETSKLSTKACNSLNELNIGAVKEIKLIDSNYLVIVDKSADNRGIHIIDKETLKPLAQTGVKGEGPQEISRYNQIIPYKKGFLMVDYSKHLIYYYNIQEVLKKENYLPSVFSKIENFLTSIQMGKNNQYTATKMDVSEENNNVLLLNIVKGNFMDKQIIKHIAHNARIDSKLENMDPSKLLCYLEKDRDRMCISYTSYNMISIVDAEGNSIRNIMGGKNMKKSNEHCYFKHAQFCNDYLFVDHQDKPIYKKKNNGKNYYVGFDNLLTLDRQGNLLKSMKTDHNFDQFVVLPNQQEVILYRENSDAPFSIGKFTI